MWDGWAHPSHPVSQVQVDDVSFSSLIHQFCSLIIQSHQISQAQIAPSKAVLAITKQILNSNVPLEFSGGSAP